MVVSDDEPVQRIPRSRGFRLSPAQLMRVLLTATLLVMVILIQRPCADAVSGFVTSFDHEGSASGIAKPGTIDRPSNVGSASDYEQLRPDMSEAELKAAIERAKAKAAARSAGSAGSAEQGAGSAGSAEQGAGSAER